MTGVWCDALPAASSSMHHGVVDIGAEKPMSMRLYLKAVRCNQRQRIGAAARASGSHAAPSNEKQALLGAHGRVIMAW